MPGTGFPEEVNSCLWQLTPYLSPSPVLAGKEQRPPLAVPSSCLCVENKWLRTPQHLLLLCVPWISLPKPFLKLPPP